MRKPRSINVAFGRIRRQARTYRRIALAVFLGGIFAAQTTILPLLAAPVSDYDSVIHGFPAYEEGCDTTSDVGGTAAAGLDKFLRALAFKESGGKADEAHRPSPGATGKYQYKDDTWKGVVAAYFPEGHPARSYARAHMAPEAIQDATAFFEYSKKSKQLGDNVFKLAVSHFLPAANTNPDLLDIKPAGNSITPREYADEIVKMTKTNGPWDKLPLKYTDAPQFKEIAEKQGIDLTQPGAGNLKFIDLGKIKKDGPPLMVGASIYGGRFKDGKWQPTNPIQDPEVKNKPHEDTGKGNDGQSLAGTTSFAELSNPGTKDFSALGNLIPNLETKTPRAKLAITYNGKTIVAEKRDVGGGGDAVKKDGKDYPRAVDLWWEAARLLDFKEGLGVIQVRAVDPSTPVTPAGGGALAEQDAADECVPECAASSGSILIDPGHSGGPKADNKKERSPEGLMIWDSSNDGERKQVFETAVKVRDILRKKGYKVSMTKEKEDDYKNLLQRAQQANTEKSALAVSIHSTGGSFSNPEATWVSPQRVGDYRENPGTRTEFKLKDVAKESLRIAEEIKKEREKAEGRPVAPTSKHLEFDTREDLSDGNIPIVQLYSKVPWVYNEVGQTGFDATKYAEGIANGIMKAVKAQGGNEADESCSGGQGDIVAKAEALAWHDGRKSHTPRAEYPKAVKRSNSSVGMGAIEDCGAFVATVMKDSKVDPKFPAIGTSTIAAYLEKEKDKKYEFYPGGKIKDTSKLAPGDILVVNKGSGQGAKGHTYLYIGPHGKFTAASASLTTYMPTYNVTYLEDTIGRGWYSVGRFKGGQVGDNI